MESLSPFVKILCFFFIMVGCFTHCTNTFYPPSEDYAFFYVDGQSMQIRVEPYINAMPGAKSDHVIIPINLYMENSDERGEWPRKFKLTKVQVSGVDPQYTTLDRLDHNSWMHNTSGNDSGNALRVLEDIMPGIFDIFIWFKDDRGKGYKTVFRGLSAGLVQ